jgi:serine/threonine-protein kinase HipA
MHKPVQAIEVRIWGKTVGAVALAPNLGYYAFEYDSRFVTSGIELAPLTMPLTEAREPFIFVDLPELSFKRLPAMVEIGASNILKARDFRRCFSRMNGRM